MATHAVIPHRLIPGATVSLCDLPINLRVTDLEAYGCGTADWDQYEVPAFVVGADVTVTIEGGTWVGAVKTISGGVGERILYHVSCAGPADALKADATVEGVFIDRDLSQWKTADSGWEGWPEGQINVSLTDKLAFFWPTIEPDTGTDLVLVDTSEPKTGYGTLMSNTPPDGWSATDFSASKALWSAAYYQIGGGATSKRISSVSFIPVADLSQAAINALTTPDYNTPIAPVVPAGEDADFYGTTEAEVNHFATYPDMNLWGGLYGSAAPANCFLGLYACNDLAQLPTADPDGMQQSQYLIYRFANVLYPSSGRVTIDVDAKFLVFYSCYRSIRFPDSQLAYYSSDAAHLLRTAWRASTKLMAQRGQWAYIYGLEVRAQGYKPIEPGGPDDLARAFRILSPGCDVTPMIIPPSIDGSPGVTIALRNATTLPAAVADLLALYPQDMSYGWRAGGLRIHKKPDGAYTVYDEPGVDTTGASTTNEGAVDIVFVAYMAATGTPSPGTLAVVTPSFLTVDKNGTYTLVDETWEPTPGQRAVFIDATAESSLLAAVRKGQSVAIEQRPEQGCGSVTLKAIAGAAAVQAGCALTGPGIAADSAVTSVSVDVGSDTATLEIGHSGFVGRFPSNSPGVPLSTTPTSSAKPTTSLDLRRSAG